MNIRLYQFFCCEHQAPKFSSKWPPKGNPSQNHPHGRFKYLTDRRTQPVALILGQPLNPNNPACSLWNQCIAGDMIGSFPVSPHNSVGFFLDFAFDPTVLRLLLPSRYFYETSLFPVTSLSSLSLSNLALSTYVYQVLFYQFTCPNLFLSNSTLPTCVHRIPLYQQTPPIKSISIKLNFINLFLSSSSLSTYLSINQVFVDKT